MEFFYVTEDFNFNIPFDDGNKITLNLKKPKNGKPDLSTVYASTGACVTNLNAQLEHAKKQLPKSFKLKILNTANKKQIYESDEFPIILSNFDGTESETKYNSDDMSKLKIIPDTEFVPLEKRLEPILDQKSVKVFIVNGMGTGLGDGIIGLNALNIFYNRLKHYFEDVTIDLSHTAVVGDKAHQSLYSQESIVNSLCYLPITVEKLMEYDLVIDNSAMILRENFSKLPMVDFYLKNMSIEPDSVAKEEKRIFIRNSDQARKSCDTVIKNLRKDPGKKLIFLHTSSSTQIRSMPKDLIKRTIKQILDFDKDFIVVTWDKILNLKQDIDKYLGPRKNRHVNISFKNNSFDHYTYFISQMDALITVDTSSYHIADSFDIPTLVIFQTIEPELRIKYYPYCEGVKLIENNKLDGMHLSFDKKHQEYLDKHWKKFEIKNHLSSLRKMMNKKETAIKDKNNYINCPICDNETYNKPSDQYGNYKLLHCKNCDSEFSVVRTEMDRSEIFADLKQIYISNDKKLKKENVIVKLLDRPYYEHYIDFMQSLEPKGTYLDYGCKTGFLISYANGLGFESYGLETDKDFINFGRKFFELKKNQLQEGLHISSKYAGMPDTFDLISTFDVIENLENPKDFAKKVYDKLNPGGYWIFTTVNKKRLEYMSGCKNAKKHINLPILDYPGKTLQRMNLAGHRALLEGTDFEIFQQQASRVQSSVSEIISGPLPQITANIEKNRIYNFPMEDLKKIIFEFYQSSFNGIENAGDYITTIVRKPIK